MEFKMIVLTRKTNEAITITTPNGEKIEVAVTKINGGQVQIGVKADKTINVLRNELVSLESHQLSTPDIANIDN